MSDNRKAHWENVYTKKAPGEVSWYQDFPKISLDLIAMSGIDKTQKIIDVGGGASVLVDHLLDKGFKDLTVLDISSAAIGYAKDRIGERAKDINWIEADATEYVFSHSYDLWHDRAVFHFLVDAQDRKKYIKCMDQGLEPGGHLIISTFAVDGPEKCSGLDVMRYSPSMLKKELGDNFNFIKSISESHVTPWNTEQKFTYCYFKKQPDIL